MTMKEDKQKERTSYELSNIIAYNHRDETRPRIHRREKHTETKINTAVESSRHGGRYRIRQPGSWYTYYDSTHF